MHDNTKADHRQSPAWTLAVASLALMMAFLDSLVVTTALPTLRVSLHSSLASLEWTVNAYNLAFACLLLTGAALGDRFSRPGVYSSPDAFVAGFRSALWIAVAFSAIGIPLALSLKPTPAVSQETLPKTEAAVPLGGTADH
jgi:MFS family permease